MNKQDYSEKENSMKRSIFIILSSTWLLASSMSGCEDVGTYKLSMIFPSADAEHYLSDVTIWAYDAQTQSCTQLMVHSEINPDDLASVAKLNLSYPVTESPRLEVPFGETVFYVRAYNSEGALLLHGCSTTTVKSGSDAKVSIDLLWLCHPGDDEIPADGKDNDCDGMTDECISDTECKNGNYCQEGKCENGECVFHDRTAGYPCSDGNPCSLDDKCLDGECVGGSWKDCSDLDTGCSRGVCNEISGTCTEQAVEEGSSCDDGLFCTVGETCTEGQCSGEANLCDDGEECTQDVCREDQGICDHILQPKPGLEGPFGDATCSDGLDNDCDGLTDDADNNCIPCTATTECDDGNECTDDTCDTNTGACHNDPVANGTSCSDGLYCTDPDSCQDGICHGEPRDCSSETDQCNIGMCSESHSACEKQPANNQQPCDDGDPCTMEEKCVFGTCTGRPLDLDSDTFADEACGYDDCDDTNPNINPGTNEGPAADPTCSDGLDNDCDGLTDSDDIGCSSVPVICTRDNWCWQNPMPQGNTIKDIWASSPDNVWVVGDYGTIMHWDGNNWNNISCGTENSLNGVWGTSTGEVWAVGYTGTVLHYKDNQCSVVSFGSNDDLNDVWVDENMNYVWVVGTGLHYWDIDFTEWTHLGGGVLLGVWGFGDKTWAVGQNGAILFYDGTEAQTQSSTTTSTLYGVWGTGTDDVWSVGENGTILHWDGSGWSDSSTGILGTLRAVSGLQDGEKWIAGSGGLIFHATQGGDFSRIASNTSLDLWAVAATSSDDVMVAGTQGIILYQDAGGDSFSENPSYSSIRESFNDVWAASATDAWAVGGEYQSNAGVLVHWDGDTWKLDQFSSTLQATVVSVWGTGPDNVWILTWKGGVYQYDESGWQNIRQDSQDPDYLAYEIWASSENDIWIADSDGAKHFDGASWQSHDLSSFASVVWGISPDDVWFAGGGYYNSQGQEPAIYHWDGSQIQTFTSCDIQWVSDFAGIWASGANDVWILASGAGMGDGVIFRWDGQSCTTAYPGSSDFYNVRSIFGFGPDQVWTSAGSQVFRWDGQFWSVENASTWIQSIFGADNRMWAVGYSGAILKKDL